MKVYKILSETSRALLEEKVTRYLLKGFIPHGSLQITQVKEPNGMKNEVEMRYVNVNRYIQPVVKS